MRKLCLHLFVCVLLLASAGKAMAEGFGLYEYSARGVALGGGMVARTPDASALAFNPAQITRLPGINLMGGLTTISLGGKMRWENSGSSGSTEMERRTWVVPHLYYTQQLGDDWFIGVGEFTRYGLGFKYPRSWPGRMSIYEIGLTTFSINPNVAWRATEKLSLNAGIEFVYGTLELKKRTLHPLAGELDIRMSDMEDFVPGFNLSLHYKFNEEWAAGLVYRSRLKAKLEGDAKVTVLANGAVAQKGDVSSKVTLPDSFAGAVSWSPIPALSLELGATYTLWSTFDSLDFDMPDGSTSKNPKDWENVWRISFSGEWQACDWLALRAGYVFDQSPMVAKYEDYLVPTDNRHIFSLGAGFKWQAWTLDLSYAYIYAIGRKYEANSLTHTLDSEADVDPTNVFSLSIGYRF